MVAITQLLRPEEFFSLNRQELDLLDCWLQGQVLADPVLRDGVTSEPAVSEDVGARIAATLLSRPEVRSELEERARGAYEALRRTQRAETRE